jgi:hypothetical protein
MVRFGATSPTIRFDEMLIAHRGVIQRAVDTYGSSGLRW